MCEQYVARLEVAVGQAVGVQVGQPVAHLHYVPVLKDDPDNSPLRKFYIILFQYFLIRRIVDIEYPTSKYFPISQAETVPLQTIPPPFPPRPQVCYTGLTDGAVLGPAVTAQCFSQLSVVYLFVNSQDR